MCLPQMGFDLVTLFMLSKMRCSKVWMLDGPTSWQSEWGH